MAAIKKNIWAAVGVFIFVAGCALMSFAQDARTPEESAFSRGVTCYRNKEWNDAQILLTQAAESATYNTDYTWYMIIFAEICNEDFSQAVNSCDYFISNFPQSTLKGAVEYQRGRALHCVGQNDSAVMALGGFCNEYPESPLYSSALYWLAECFYEDEDFETSRALYERIISEFPESPKYEDAQFKIYLLTQRDREQKLLHLLKVTGEEYLTAREDYERELKTIQTEDTVQLRRQLREANDRISELENEITQTAAQRAEEEAAAAAGSDAAESSGEDEGEYPNEDLYILRQKAATIRRILNEQNGGTE